MASVSLKSVGKNFGGTTAVHNVSLEVEDGEFLVLLGPSGCGKSTLLRMIAGLEQITSGVITIDDRVVNDIEPKDRDVAMVFQSYALYPHLTVSKNIAFPLKVRGHSPEEVNSEIEAVAAMLGLESLLDRKPGQLSGGQRQRVALARAIVRKPKVFLMDEPLSNLDAKLRSQTRADLARLHREMGITTIYVTHDQVEAMTLGQRIAVMESGELQQVGSPDDVYNRPSNPFVAEFIGSPPMTTFSVDVSDSLARVSASGNGWSLPGEAGSGRATVGVRPEDLEIVDESEGISATVLGVELLGHESLIMCELVDSEGANRLVVVRHAGQSDLPNVGQLVGLKPSSIDAVHVFETAGANKWQHP